MFNIPLEGTQAREFLGDMSHVAELLSPANRGKLPTFGEALRKARRFIDENRSAGVRGTTVICYGNCNVPSQYQQIILLHVGPRGGFRKVWDFGAA